MSTNRGIGLIDPAVRPGRNPSASRLETTDRLVRGITGSGSMRVSYRLGKIKISQTSAAAKKKPFDLDPAITGLDLRLMTYMTDTTAFVSLRGAGKVVQCGTGWTLSTTTYCLTMTASKLIYLKFSRANASVTIESADSATVAFVTPDDYTYRPLWYIPVVDTAIDIANCIDLRDSYFIDGIS